MTECTRCRRQYADGVRFCPVDGFATVELSDPFLGRQLLGQFQLLSACGRGATGTVYRAQQSGMDRQVAVKILRADLLQDPTVVKRFVREARAGARLGHPNIATVHLVGQTEDGVPYIVMEYVEGAPLSALLAAEAPLPVGRLLHIGEQIASALAEAHDKGIIHRDLKPENILLTGRRGDPDVVKVVDFGIAKIVADHYNSDSQLSRIGTVFGTPHYIAPEQASGADIDHRADLYSLGCILFQMATGRVPFEGTSGIQVLLRHLREDPPDPRALNPSLPEPVGQVIRELLRKDRAERLQDGETVLRRLRALREGLRSMPQPPALSTAEALFDRVAAGTGAGGPRSAPEGTPASPSISAGSDDEDQETAEADLSVILPWWRRRAGAFVGAAIVLGLVAGTVFAVRAQRGGRALTLVPSPSLIESAIAPPAPASRPAGSVGPASEVPMAKRPTAAARPAAPTRKRADLPVKEEDLPEVHFPVNGPPRHIDPLPPEKLALPAKSETLLPNPLPPVPAARMEPSAALPPAPASPPKTEPAAPASPPVVKTEPGQPTTAPEPPPEPPPAQQPVLEEEEPAQDPYHMLK